jgi:hypothetical protein
VNALLPRAYSTTDLPASTDTTYLSLNTHITDVSRWIDSAIGLYYCTFNAVDHSTYICPQPVTECATYEAAARCYGQLAVGGRNAAYTEKAKELHGYAVEWLGGVVQAHRDDDPKVAFIIPPETVSTETLTFGAGGEYDIQAQEAFINVHSNLTSADIPTLIPESVKVTATGLTQYRYGDHFSIGFNPQHQKWVFFDHKGSLYSAGVTKSIAYQWSWRRWNEIQPEIDQVPSLGGF